MASAGQTAIPSGTGVSDFAKGGSSATATSGNQGGGAAATVLPMNALGGMGVYAPFSLDGFNGKMFGAGGQGGANTNNSNVRSPGWNSAGNGEVDTAGGGDLPCSPGKANTGQGGGGAATYSSGNKTGCAGASGMLHVMW